MAGEGIGPPAARPVPDSSADGPAPSVPSAADPATGGPVPTEEPVWPDDSAEEAYLSERRPADDRGTAAGPPPAPAGPVDGPRETLPPLDAMVQRVPEGVRASLDELFRARFTGVRRVPREALKP